jgi:hypothetical protein
VPARELGVGRGRTILTLGVASVVLCTLGAVLPSLGLLIGFPMALISWSMANSDLQAMAKGEIDPKHRGVILTGRTLGVAATGLAAVLLALVLGGLLFSVSGP